MGASAVGVDRPPEGHAGGLWHLVDDPPGVDVEAGAGMLYALTLPAVWDALVGEQGWSAEEYRTRAAAWARLAGGMRFAVPRWSSIGSAFDGRSSR